MTEQQQLAVEIAEDALALLASEKIETSPGSYFNAYFGEAIDQGDDVKSTFEALSSEDACEVCALGAMMLATTLKKNELTYRDMKKLHQSRKAQEMLLTVLTPHQMALIEAAFEGSYNLGRNDGGEDDYVVRIARKLQINPIKSLSESEDIACHVFFKHFPNPEDRFKEIMNNIIQNNGVFTL